MVAPNLVPSELLAQTLENKPHNLLDVSFLTLDYILHPNLLIAYRYSCRLRLL